MLVKELQKSPFKRGKVTREETMENEEELHRGGALSDEGTCSNNNKKKSGEKRRFASGQVSLSKRCRRRSCKISVQRRKKNTCNSPLATSVGKTSKSNL